MDAFAIGEAETDSETESVMEEQPEIPEIPEQAAEPEQEIASKAPEEPVKQTSSAFCTGEGESSSEEEDDDVPTPVPAVAAPVLPAVQKVDRPTVTLHSAPPRTSEKMRPSERSVAGILSRYTDQLTSTAMTLHEQTVDVLDSAHSLTQSMATSKENLKLTIQALHGLNVQREVLGGE